MFRMTFDEIVKIRKWDIDTVYKEIPSNLILILMNVCFITESASSEGKGEDRPARRRSPSFSLVIDEWAPQGSAYYECWQYLMPLIPSSDESEILSIQVGLKLVPIYRHYHFNLNLHVYKSCNSSVYKVNPPPHTLLCFYYT